uniref:Large neutral amino acids transporter small subunit 1-like n=1 Tax=Saccoglossus kowalevskii TaxID=10224 RepID=A0ABM0MV08_SACKO
MKFRETDSDLRSPKPVGEGDGFHIKKQLTLGDGILLMVGLVIGSGIFISPKGVFMYSGSVGVALVIWVVCGIFSMMGALCMAELGTTITKFGGEYIYLYKIFGPLPGFVYLWIAAIIIKPTVAAIIALTFAEYVVHPVSLACDTNTRNTKRLIATLCV